MSQLVPLSQSQDTAGQDRATKVLTQSDRQLLAVSLPSLGAVEPKILPTWNHKIISSTEVGKCL